MFRRFLQGIGFTTLVALGGIAREGDEPWIRGVYTGESPRPVRTSELEAWQQARELAASLPGAFVLIGSGRSMQPLYAPGTILVLQELPFGELKRGQTVLYRSRDRKTVAHVLVAKARDGWRVRGLNNRVHDMEPVQSGNLVGIVVAAFKPVSRRQAIALATAHRTARMGTN